MRISDKGKTYQGKNQENKKSRIVGYASLVGFKEAEDHSLKEDQMDEFTLTPEEKKELLKIARSTLVSYLKDKTVPQLLPQLLKVLILPEEHLLLLLRVVNCEVVLEE